MDFFTTSFVTTLETEMTSDEWRTSVLVAVFKTRIMWTSIITTEG